MGYKEEWRMGADDMKEFKDAQIDALRTELKKKDNLLEWFNFFVDFIEEVDPSLYNEACEYADNWSGDGI